MFYIANAAEAPPIPEHLSAECKDFVSKCLRYYYTGEFCVMVVRTCCIAILNCVFPFILKQNPSAREIQCAVAPEPQFHIGR